MHVHIVVTEYNFALTDMQALCICIRFTALCFCRWITDLAHIRIAYPAEEPAVVTIENLYSPDNIAYNNENKKNNIKLANLTMNNTVIKVTRGKK